MFWFLFAFLPFDRFLQLNLRQVWNPFASFHGFRFALLAAHRYFSRNIGRVYSCCGHRIHRGRVFRFHRFGSIFCRSFFIFDCAKRSSSLPSSVPFPIFGRVTPIISDYRRISSHDFRNMTEFPVRRNTIEFVFYVFLLIFFSQHSCCSSPALNLHSPSAKSPNSVLPGALPHSGYPSYRHC